MPFDCHICPLAKQHRLPFTHSSSISLSCFDLVHADIWGPYSTPSLNGSRYFLTLVDDHSRCTGVYLLKHESDASTLIQSFFHMILTQFNVPIKCLGQIMDLNFPFLLFMLLRVSFINCHVLKLHSKMLWLKENIGIF